MQKQKNRSIKLKSSSAGPTEVSLGCSPVQLWGSGEGGAGDPQEHPMGRDHSGSPLYQFLKQKLLKRRRFWRRFSCWQRSFLERDHQTWAVVWFRARNFFSTGILETIEFQEMKHLCYKRSVLYLHMDFMIQGLRQGSKLLIIQVLICYSSAYCVLAQGAGYPICCKW